MQFFNPAYSPIIAAIIAVPGFFIAIKLKNKGDERTRRLDLLKIVYPERLKAATDIMNTISVLYQTSMGMHKDKFQDYDENAFKSVLGELLLTTRSYEYLLGKPIVNLVFEFVSLCSLTYGNNAKPDHNPILEQSYKEISTELRRCLHIDMIDNLFPLNQQLNIGEKT